MIYLIEIGAGQLNYYINIAFEDDKELSNYHISPGTTEQMIAHTAGMISDAATQYKLELYGIVHVKEGVKKDIGFTVLIREPVKVLYSFGVNILYRTKEILTEWLQRVKNQLADFYIVLNDKNVRAITFFERNGFIKEYFEDQHIVKLCQQ